MKVADSGIHKKKETANIGQVVAGRLCCGCGACVPACPVAAIALVHGARLNYALLAPGKCVHCGTCAAVCPMFGIMRGDMPPPSDGGPVIEQLLAHSGNVEERRGAASGGFVSALCRTCLRYGIATHVVEVRASTSDPYDNETVVITDPEEVGTCRGSRYSPASACTAIEHIAKNTGRYLFVGKGCEIRALRAYEKLHPEIGERILLRVGLLCKQTPPRTATIEYLRSQGLDPAADVDRIAYRGEGWPGSFVAYRQGTPILTRPFSVVPRIIEAEDYSFACSLCSDLMAEGADISVGDPHGIEGYRDVGDGMTWVQTRNEAASAILREAMVFGEFATEPAPAGWAAARVKKAVEGRNRRALRNRESYLAARAAGAALKAWLGIGKAHRFVGKYRAAIRDPKYY